MIKQIYEFRTLEDAISTLEKFGNDFKFPSNKLSKKEIVLKSVAPNIFRAFQNLNISPSVIYRQWAMENFDSLLIDFQMVNSNSDYYKFIQKYGDSLIQRWAEVTLKPDTFLMYGPALKMINLLIKWIQESDQYRQRDKYKFQQIPFDSFSLIPIRLIINDLTSVKYKISIPINASMGFVNTPQLYSILMDSIYKLSKLSKVDPVVYDYWAWEDKHVVEKI